MKPRPNRSQSRTRDNQGFSLVEVLIAMMIMAVAIAALATSWSSNVNSVEIARVNNTTAMLLQRKMNEIEIQYMETPVAEIPEEDDGDFGSAFPQYKWKLESREFELPNLSSLLSSKEGGVKGEELTILSQMSNLTKQLIKEVRVTVIYTSKKNKREVKNSVATFFVDYNKEIDPLGGMGGAMGNMMNGAGGGGATGGAQ